MASTSYSAQPDKRPREAEEEDEKMEDDTMASSSSSTETDKSLGEEEEECDSREASEMQMVLCDLPADHGAEEPTTSQKKKKKKEEKKKDPVWAYTVQCHDCLKWRLMPKLSKYQQIRAVALEEPFTCSKAPGLWHLMLSCDDPHEISPVGTLIWALDKPGIPKPPRGWPRDLRIRAPGGTRFADVYYTAPPIWKKLRSVVEVRKYLAENPDHAGDLTEYEFSFSAPNPFDPNYCRRPTPAPAASRAAQPENSTSLSAAALAERLAEISRMLATELIPPFGVNRTNPEAQDEALARPDPQPSDHIVEEPQVENVERGLFPENAVPEQQPFIRRPGKEPYHGP